jgi:hypothetical protein
MPEMALADRPAPPGVDQMSICGLKAKAGSPRFLNPAMRSILHEPAAALHHIQLVGPPAA